MCKLMVEKKILKLEYIVNSVYILEDQESFNNFNPSLIPNYP